MNSPAAVQTGWSSARPRVTRSLGSRPFSLARASTVCTSRAKPRVPTAGRAPPASGRLGLVGQQALEHDVLLGGAQQSQRSSYRPLGRSADQSVGEGGRSSSGWSHRAADAGGDPVTQLLCGLAAEGQREHGQERRPGARCGPRSPRQEWSSSCAGTGEDQQRAASWSTTDCWKESRTGAVVRTTRGWTGGRTSWTNRSERTGRTLRRLGPPAAAAMSTPSAAATVSPRSGGERAPHRTWRGGSPPSARTTRHRARAVALEGHHPPHLT